MFFPEAYQELDADSRRSSVAAIDAAEHPVIAEINVIAAAALELLGPMLWAALIVLFVVAEFSTN